MERRSPRGASPIASGSLLAIISALLFGAATPAVQRLGRGLGPFSTAALLYAGAASFAAALVFVRPARRRAEQAPVRRAHLGRLLAVAVVGAVAAPVALAWGLQRSSGAAASLLLNLEATFTIALGAVLHREHVGRRVALAAALMTLGGALLVLARGAAGQAQAWGLLAVAGATLGWALDNALSRPLAELDPSAVVAAKGALGAALSFTLATGLGEPRAGSPARTAGLLACGAIGYGVSLRLYLLAQRRLGAGRTASVFALAPFAGAAIAWLLGEPFGGASGALGGALMVIGAALHLTEQHDHVHTHEAALHEHAHHHDDGHHDHAHDPMPQGAHSHSHHHAPVTHEHAHAPDVHHRHPHDE